jgi:hypothetical protein
VHDPFLMRRADCIGQRNRQREDVGQRQAALGDEIVQRPALDQLHREEEHAVGFFHGEDRDDVGMVERGNALRLAFEAGAAFRVGSGLVRKNLDRDVALQLGSWIMRAIHLAHSASTEQRQDFVWTEPGARGQRHFGGILRDRLHRIDSTRLVDDDAPGESISLMKLLFRALALVVALATTGVAVVFTQSQSPAVPAGVPNISGTFAGRRCVPANSDVCPEMNAKGAERLMTARGKALIAAFDELAAPKYDCSPAGIPIIFGDPWAVRIEQLADRVIFTYEKDDVLRTVWLEGHGHQRPRSGLLFMHGYSTGRYEGNQLVVETSRFTFDPEGFAGDVINAPSSTQKRLVERYSRSGNALRLELTAEDPVFLLGPITYTIDYPETKEPLSLPWNCDPASAQRNLHVVKSKYPQDPPINRRNSP